jgi:hypothetical protein
MARFVVTLPFTVNGVGDTTVIGVPVAMAPDTTTAITVAENAAESYITAKFSGQTVVFGTATAVAA